MCQKTDLIVVRISEGFELPEMIKDMSHFSVELKPLFNGAYNGLRRFVVMTCMPNTVRGFLKDCQFRYPGVSIYEETASMLDQLHAAGIADPGVRADGLGRFEVHDWKGWEE